MDGVATFIGTEALVLTCHHSPSLQRKLTPFLTGSKGDLYSIRRSVVNRCWETSPFAELSATLRKLELYSDLRIHESRGITGSGDCSFASRIATRIYRIGHMLSSVYVWDSFECGQAYPDASALSDKLHNPLTPVERVSWLFIDDSAWEKSWGVTAGSAWGSLTIAVRRLIEG